MIVSGLMGRRGGPDLIKMLQLHTSHRGTYYYLLTNESRFGSLFLNDYNKTIYIVL